jgi:uncharacterized OsmC-like protein
VTSDELRAQQAPLKTLYKDDPTAAQKMLRAEGLLSSDDLSCRVETPLGRVSAGLHPATGGDGTAACSGDMLLQSLAACAGVTLSAVATAMNIPVRGGRVVVEGDLDFRGTLGVSKETPVGFQAIRVSFDLDTDATDDQRATLLKLTERYCVIYQTLKNPPALAATMPTTAQSARTALLPRQNTSSAALDASAKQ